MKEVEEVDQSVAAGVHLAIVCHGSCDDLSLQDIDADAHADADADVDVLIASPACLTAACHCSLAYVNFLHPKSNLQGQEHLFIVVGRTGTCHQEKVHNISQHGRFKAISTHRLYGGKSAYTFHVRQ